MSQAEVDQADEVINSAMITFLASQNPLADKSVLNNKLLDANDIITKAIVGTSPTQFPQLAKNTFAAVIAKSDSVKNSSIATQTEVNNQITILENAITAFKAAINPGADKTELLATIDTAYSKLVGIKVPRDYPQTAVDELFKAITSANKVKINTEATQLEVDAETASLKQIIALFLSTGTQSGFENAEIATSIGPNPVVNIVTIKSTDVIKTITIYSLLGKEFKQIKSKSSNVDIDMSDLNAGSYFIQIILSDDSTILKQIIKE